MEEFFNEYLKVDLWELVMRFVPIILVFIVCLLVIKIVNRLVRNIIKKSKIEKSLHTFIETTVKIVLYAIMVLIIADMLNIPVTSLIATFSVVGLAASLAIQDSLGNLASGIMLLATHPFRVGDFIDASGTSGTVEDINFSCVSLLTPDNKIIRVPNKQIINSIITNFSEQPKRRVDITFNVAYSANSDKVKAIMGDAIKRHPKVLKNEPIFVRTTAYAASGIDYTLRVWASGADYWDVYFDLLEGIKADFDSNGIEIPYNQLDVHVHNS